MSQTPSRDEALDREARCSENAERSVAAANRDEAKIEEAVPPPPPQRRRDPAHSDVLRQPFLLK